MNKNILNNNGRWMESGWILTEFLCGLSMFPISFQSIYCSAPWLPSYRRRSYACCLALRLALAALDLMISRLAVLILLFPFLMPFTSSIQAITLSSHWPRVGSLTPFCAAILLPWLVEDQNDLQPKAYVAPAMHQDQFHQGDGHCYPP